MSVTIAKKIQGIQHFLEQEILPEVAGDKRSELRAALKLLATLRDEIESAPPRLTSEARGLLDVLDAAQPLLPDVIAEKFAERRLRLDRELANGPGTLSHLEGVCRNARSLIAEIAAKLSEQQRTGCPTPRAMTAIAAIYDRLGADACAKTPYQSVFHGRLYSPEKDHQES